MPRGETIERAFKIIRMFERGPVTRRMVADAFGVHRISAGRWIDQASRFLPIVEDGLDYSNGSRPSVIYRLMK